MRISFKFSGNWGLFCSKHPKQALVQTLSLGCSKFFLKTILTYEIDFMFEMKP